MTSTISTTPTTSTLPTRRPLPLEQYHAALTGPCNGCHAEGAVLTCEGHERHCPACHSTTLLYRAAEDHLHTLLEPAFSAWAQHWHPTLTRQHLLELSNLVTARLESQLEAVTKPETGTEAKRDGAVT